MEKIGFQVEWISQEEIQETNHGNHPYETLGFTKASPNLSKLLFYSYNGICRNENKI